MNLSATPSQSPAECDPLLGGRSADFVTNDRLLDLRARQRTSASFYRTALGEFGFALIILKLFEARFVMIGMMYTVFALILLGLGWLRFELGRFQFEKSNGKTFVTCGAVVLLTRFDDLIASVQRSNLGSVCAIALNIALLLILLRM